ncbi:MULTISPECIES: DUF1697 domain-containing protein [Subtercola]|uniref:DUF1697 domain-containing protein n=1 Tax=Subtercola TaxID=120212 RepID=UPI0013760BE0|nr:MULTISPECIES: DUF1697 domain-containing protein [Subtercola]MEA9986521.1 DUF1697 domain-containing protein [Subtercola sp. RTI3]
MSAQHYVGLVRGINVGPTTRVAMADFRQVFESLGFADVKTLLQSGNVVFTTDRMLTADDTAAVERDFHAATGLKAGFVILAAARFHEIVAANPLQSIAADPSKAVVTFVPGALDAQSIALPDPAATLPEVLALGDGAVYSWHPEGISNSRLPVSFWKQLGPVYTARNLNTAAKLQALLDERA